MNGYGDRGCLARNLRTWCRFHARQCRRGSGMSVKACAVVAAGHLLQGTAQQSSVRQMASYARTGGGCDRPWGCHARSTARSRVEPGRRGAMGWRDWSHDLAMGTRRHARQLATVAKIHALSWRVVWAAAVWRARADRPVDARRACGRLAGMVVMQWARWFEVESQRRRRESAIASAVEMLLAVAVLLMVLWLAACVDWWRCLL